MRRIISYIFGALIVVGLAHPFALAETFIINAGGGGEPLTDGTNQFLSPLRETERLGTAKGARVFSFFNSDTWPKDQFTNPESVKPFNEENLLATLETIKQRVKESKGKNQVMLHINTHGSPNDHTGTHRWVADDKRWIDPDTLLVKIQELLMRGANVALVDQSCFSGNTLLVFKDLLKKYPDQLCIMTGATQFGYGRGGGITDTIVHNFLASEEKQNLEDVFWKTYLNPENVSPQKGIALISSTEFEGFLHPLESLDFPPIDSPYYRGSETLEQVPTHLQSVVCEAESLLSSDSMEQVLQNSMKVFIEIAKDEIKKAQEESIPKLKKLMNEFKRDQDNFSRKWSDVPPIVASMPKTLCNEIETTTRSDNKHVYKHTYCKLGKYRMYCHDRRGRSDNCMIDATEPYAAIYTQVGEEEYQLNLSYLSHEQADFFNDLLRKEGTAQEYSREKLNLKYKFQEIDLELFSLKRKLYGISPQLIHAVYQKKKSEGEVRKACENFSL